MSLNFFRDKKNYKGINIITILNIWNVNDFERYNLSFLFQHIHVEYIVCKKTRKNIILFVVRIIQKYKNEKITPKQGYFLDIIYFLRCINMKKLSNIFLNFLESINYTVIPYRGLTYLSNSCYMDSALVCLLSSPNSIIENMLNSSCYNSLIVSKNIKDVDNIKNELRNIHYNMYYKNESYNCKKLKEILRNFYSSENYFSNKMQDAGEFLYTIFNIFNLNTVKRRRRTFVIDKDPIKVSDVIENCNPIYNISVFSIKDKQSVNITDFIEEVTDEVLDKNNMYKLGNKVYDRKLDIYTIQEAEYIIFNVDRRYIKNNIKIETAVICPENIYIGNRLLFLTSVIVHKNLHYTCYNKIGYIWYKYDDNPSGLECIVKKVGFYDDMLNYNIEKDGTLFFYT
jgi:hypothetical protein